MEQPKKDNNKKESYSIQAHLFNRMEQPKSLHLSVKETRMATDI